MVEFLMPSLGADMEDGTLIQWNVKVGDTVKRGDIVAVVETQKGLVEIEIFDEGKIEQLIVKENEKVPVGKLMALISPVAKEKSSGMEISKAPVKSEIITEEIHPVDLSKSIHVSPLARRMAEENQINLSGIKGTGAEGAIIREDIEKIIREKNKVPAENIRKAVASAMSRSKREIPHYYLETKIDMKHSLEWLSEANKQRSVADRLLLPVLLIKAVAKALKDAPGLNGWWVNDLQLKSTINVGFVVSLRTGGIIVPTIYDADKKTLDELMRTMSDIVPRAKSLKLRSSELAGSSITITSLGDDGAEIVYGIIYPPQIALVGFGAITEQPWAERGMLTVRPVLTATLSADHRATDGKTGSKFLLALKNYLQQPEQL